MLSGVDSERGDKMLFLRHYTIDKYMERYLQCYDTQCFLVLTDGSSPTVMGKAIACGTVLQIGNKH